MASEATLTEAASSPLPTFLSSHHDGITITIQEGDLVAAVAFLAILLTCCLCCCCCGRPSGCFVWLLEAFCIFEILQCLPPCLVDLLCIGWLLEEYNNRRYPQGYQREGYSML
eukprot:gnl/TRDRNA2_/TRDRNA2_57805_c0_seq1.p1 gnl/TRDRNA2_/TRDRNA2_57805_c0~~gnl/TRDRNA2_/TRDRNA2_57805_c0_seq1.p1  ORF type:complete len:113 (-),score=5.99 gnl/TRDRNA2_/TRDRNA2_57805_c0_seq1:156-494(-)